jgi:hypothetical protein
LVALCFETLFQTAVTYKQMIRQDPSWSNSLCLIELFPDPTSFVKFTESFAATIDVKVMCLCAGRGTLQSFLQDASKGLHFCFIVVPALLYQFLENW